MEEKLQQVQDYFANPIFKEKIESILEDYLDNSRCEFTPYQKNVFPICAAYYAIIEDREKQATEALMNIQQTPATPPQQGKDENTQQLNDNVATISNKEKQQNKQQNDRKHDIQSTSSPCDSPKSEMQQQDLQQKSFQNISLIQLRNQFYKKGQIDSLFQTMTDFSSVLKNRAYSEAISSKLESIHRNYKLFIKFSNVLEYFYSGVDIIQKQLMQRIIWKLYLLLKEQLNRQHSEEDIEMWAYLLHFVCTEALVCSGKTPQCIQIIPQKSVQSVLPNISYQNLMNQIVNMSTISEQVNAILLSGKLDSSKIQEFQSEFQSNLNVLSEKIFDSHNQKLLQQQKKGDTITAKQTLIRNENKNSDKSDTSSHISPKERQPSSSTNLIDEEKESELINNDQKGKIDETQTSTTSQSQCSILTQFTSLQDLEKLNKLLEKEINLYTKIEEYSFLPREEDLKQQLTTPSNKPISRMIDSQDPPGVTQDYNEYKNQNHLVNANNQQIPKKTLNFNEDVNGINLNSKLSDIERPLHSPQLNIGMQGNQLGLFQQPNTPKTPNELHPLFKMPNNRIQQMQTIVPNTPYTSLLDNFKWFNFYSKSDPTKRIDELMNKIDKEYKQKVIDEAQNIAREIHYQSKKKNEATPNSDNAIESKAAKTVSFFLNVLDKMICDEESRNCKESILIQLLENRNFIFSLFSICIMTMCFIREIKGIQLDFVCKQCKITSLDFWRVISNFAKFDKNMPEVIREQLFNFEKLILLYSIWDEKDKIMQNALKSFSEENAKNQNYEKVIVRRLISHSATRVKEICKVNDLNEEIQERVWEALLYVYRNQIQLMNGRYVDQIVICSIYALKLIKSDLFKDKEIKFKGMISACESLLHFNSDKVKKTQNDNGESLDIINFYNKIYLNPMKPYFKSTNNANDVTNFVEQTPNSIILNSSLKSSIPINFYNYTPILKEEYQQKNSIPPSPMTQYLQAVESLESPYNVNNNKLKNKLIPKTLYQQQQLLQQMDQSSNNQYINNQQHISEESQSSKNINAFGQKYQEQSIQSNTEGTPTLEQKCSPSMISPKFGTVHQQHAQNLNQNKKI